jgi:hypothetical protein
VVVTEFGRGARQQAKISVRRLAPWGSQRDNQFTFSAKGILGRHMANQRKPEVLRDLAEKVGHPRKLAGSQSLYELGHDLARVYLRYSRVHPRGTAFYGLRQVDLNQLDGHNSFICFFTDSDTPPLFLPYAEFEQVIRQSALATDGQYKVQISSDGGTNELYLPRVGRFNIDAYGGIEAVCDSLDPSRSAAVPALTHAQIQTLLGGIGHLKGYGVYIPPNNMDSLDWHLVCEFPVLRNLPNQIERAAPFAGEIDVVWLAHGRDAVSAAFEVEHSTPVYSGLLRFNDMLLTCSNASRFFIVSNELRRDLFARQLQRPTFQRSGLCDFTSFLEYTNVYDWFRRLNRAVAGDSR